MVAMPSRYEVGKTISVSIDGENKVELPPRIRRGRLVGMLFESGKSFLLPSAMRGIKDLKKYYDDHTGLTVLVVGHTDSTGKASENEALSKERADVVAAFLKDDANAWGARYDGGKPGKKWGTLEDQHMLSVVAGYDGNIDGKLGPRSAAAIKQLQRDAGLDATGKMDSATRQELCTRYMAQDETTLPEGVELTTFGAGPHHPERPGDKEEDRRRNRRVEIFLCDGPIEPAPGSPSGSEYEEWVKKCSETVDFTDSPEELVEIELEWPTDLVKRLPDDFVLRVSGPDITSRELRKETASREGEMTRFEFRFLERTKKVSLEAEAGGKKVQLWTDQLPGDLEAKLDWRGKVEELCEPDEDIDADAGGSAGGTKIPDDLGWKAMRSLQRKGL